jgi:hypothetical protein
VYLSQNLRLLNLPRGRLPSSKSDLRDGEPVVSIISQALARLDEAYRVTVLPSDIVIVLCNSMIERSRWNGPSSLYRVGWNRLTSDPEVITGRAF